MMSTQSDLNARFHYGRDFGSPDVRNLIREWDRLTNLTPLEAIEMAEDADLKEHNAELEAENGRLEDENAALTAALDQLRYNMFGGMKRFSHEFSENYDYSQESAARMHVREVAPDIADDVHACFILIEDGEVTEVWTSSSFSSHVAFSRVY